MSTSSPAGGWHPDPFGRHEARWWSGTDWTEHVSDGGAQTVDPAIPVVDGGLAMEELLRVPSLSFLLGGTRAHVPGYWPVVDEGQRVVAQVWRKGTRNHLYDGHGQKFLGSREARVGARGHKNLVVQLLDGQDQECARITHTQTTDSRLTITYGDAKLKAKLDTAKLGRELQGAVLEVDKRQVGGITAAPGPSEGSTWLRLDRDPALPDPYPLIAIGAVLLGASLVYRVAGEG
jgi:hypothetical protein